MGTTTPIRARLEVNGAVGATSAIFGGESSGIALQRNWPGVRFNTYWNEGNKSLANGYAAKFHLDPVSGYLYFDILPYVNANIVAAVANRAPAISPLGGIRSGSFACGV